MHAASLTAPLIFGEWAVRLANPSRHQRERPKNYESGGQSVKKWQCIVCGWIYDEAEGCEEEGIPPGTKWEDVPEDFVCPECGVSKEDFEMLEVG